MGDRSDAEVFVEQCERFVNLSDDLRRIAHPDNFGKVVTVSEVPDSYCRQDITSIFEKVCSVSINPRDVVFRFKRWGRQSNTCYVACSSVTDPSHSIAKLQE